MTHVMEKVPSLLVPTPLEEKVYDDDRAEEEESSRCVVTRLWGMGRWKDGRAPWHLAEELPSPNAYLRFPLGATSVAH
ncbi:hypothetical protein E2C01_087011 [Portunus trituberculatus]|uniref:Uncharacterized protein n=1 Tax=Portunus trituberculatus TaxID=210409 RepID=A0A5B7JB86_PORTR|nr:hypothetical protein [Portunus trituberculatus]